MIRRLLLVLLFAAPLEAATPLEGRTIALDPGHGTIDYQGRIINPGKGTHDGRAVEHQLTFQMAQKLGKLIEEKGGRVIYTRTPFDYWRIAASNTEDNKARALWANELKADVFISIHCDWHPRSRTHGATTYYKTPESRRLGSEIQTRMVKQLKAFNRQLKQDSYTVLDVAAMPAVLVETGYLSNRAEAKKLMSPTYQKKIAEAIASALSSYFSN